MAPLLRTASTLCVTTGPALLAVQATKALARDPAKRFATAREFAIASAGRRTHVEPAPHGSADGLDNRWVAQLVAYTSAGLPTPLIEAIAGYRPLGATNQARATAYPFTSIAAAELSRPAVSLRCGWS